MLKLFTKYMTVGIINTIIHWIVFGALVYLSAYDQSVGNLIAFLVAVTFSFFANAKFTFQARASGGRYFLFITFMGTLSFISGQLSDHYNISPLITMIEFSAISLVCGFFYSKFIVFRKKKMKISLVVPAFNEADTIPIFYKAVREMESLRQHQVEIFFINDGSSDATESIINALAVSDELVFPLSFTRNFGKESAIFAGLENATGDVIIPIDVDLQDPIEIIPALIEKWQCGADMVLAKHSDRSTDGHLKRKTAEWFYKLHNKISTPKIEENVGDFRLMSRGIVEDIKLMPERNLFMKGILSWAGG